VSGLLEKRLIFVTGKGGVGKSTVAIALGLVSARAGLRTIVVELAAQDRVHRAFADDAGKAFVEEQLAPRLFTISVDPQHAMEEYLRIKLGPLGHMLGSSKLFHGFAMATPGMRELLSIGKVWELAQLHRKTRGAAPYDLVVVDAPASGHGIGILRTPRTFAEIARVGPIAHQGGTIAETIADPEFTSVLAVATAEEMPVNETLMLRDALKRERLSLYGVIVNALYPTRFGPDDVELLREAAVDATTPLARAAIRAALSEATRAQHQHHQLARLADGLGEPLIELPYLFSDHLGRPELEHLADELEAGLAGRKRLPRAPRAPRAPATPADPTAAEGGPR
jgi:anion-transporting  ArsA/GET3 family ATPase